MEMKIKKLGRMELLAVVVLAALVGSCVASLFEPMTDEERARMIIDGTESLPQDR